MNYKCRKSFEGTQKAPGDEQDLCSRGLSKHMHFRHAELPPLTPQLSLLVVSPYTHKQ